MIRNSMEQETSNAPSNSIPQDVILHKAESPWRPRRKQDQTETDEDTKVTAELYKKVRSILNKLTPQKFQSLVKQLSKMEINTEERQNGVTDLIFERVIDIRGPCYCVAYASMCLFSYDQSTIHFQTRRVCQFSCNSVNEMSESSKKTRI